MATVDVKGLTMMESFIDIGTAKRSWPAWLVVDGSAFSLRSMSASVHSTKHHRHYSRPRDRPNTSRLSKLSVRTPK